MVKRMLEVAKYILETPPYNVMVGWPEWNVDVTSMYAGELVVNHFCTNHSVIVNRNKFDINCNEKVPTAKAFHSHCWPGILFVYYVHNR
jgi:hypothetical protein